MASDEIGYEKQPIKDGSKKKKYQTYSKGKKTLHIYAQSFSLTVDLWPKIFPILSSCLKIWKKN